MGPSLQLNLGIRNIKKGFKMLLISKEGINEYNSGSRKILG
jgi:hypothetical protein